MGNSMVTRQIKVAFVIHDRLAEPGGVSTWLAELLPELRNRGMDARAMVFKQTEEEGFLIKSLRASGVPMCTNMLDLPFRERVLWLADVLKDFGPDLLVPNYLVSGYTAGSFLRSSGMQTLVVVHTDDEMYHALRDACFGPRREFPVSGVVCVSQVLADEWKASAPAEVPVVRIPYGVAGIPGMASPPQEEFRLAYVGRMVEVQKRIGDVARAMCRAVTEIPGVKADFIGDGADRPVVESIIKAHGSPAGVRLLGAKPVSEVRNMLPQYHAIVLLSDFEGLPVCLLEGMSCGLVPICSEMRSGIGEIVHHRKTGLIVNNRGDAFVEAVGELVKSPSLWRNLSQGASEITAPFSSGRCADSWEELIRKTVNNPPAGGAAYRFRWPRWRPGFAWEFPRPVSFGEKFRAKMAGGKRRVKGMFFGRRENLGA